MAFKFGTTSEEESAKRVKLDKSYMDLFKLEQIESRESYQREYELRIENSTLRLEIFKLKTKLRQFELDNEQK